MSALVERVKDAPKIPLPVQLCSKVFMFVVKTAQIVIGAMYMDECPLERYIPIYLVVMGVCGVLLSLLSCLPCAEQHKNSPPNPLHRVCTIWNSFMSCFCVCWFIAGSVWVYRIHEPSYVKSDTDVDAYCNKTVYLFAFWNITLTYVLLGASILGGCFYACLSCRNDSDN